MSTKLTDEDVLRMRWLHHERHRTVKSLADSFRVSRRQARMILEGRTRKGAGGPIAARAWVDRRQKLCEYHVQLIRQRHEAGVPIAAIAREFDVSRTMVRKVVQGKSWKGGGTVPSAGPERP